MFPSYLLSSYKEELREVLKEVESWWADWQEETAWLEGIESTLAKLQPLAGSVSLLKAQKEQNEVCICFFQLILLLMIAFNFYP